MPDDKIPQGDFYEMMMKPEAPDTMAFQIDRPPLDNDPLHTFSQEAVNEIAEQFRMFLMARIVARSEREMPKHLRATVSLDWNPGVDQEHHHFHIRGDDKLTPLDHRHRYAWRRT